MVASVKFVGHQVATGAAAKGFPKAFMELQGQGIDFCQGLFARMITTSQGANDHGAASHSAAQVTSVTDTATKATTQTESVIVNFYASFLAEGFDDSFAAVEAALKIIARCHTHFLTKFTHLDASLLYINLFFLVP